MLSMTGGNKRIYLSTPERVVSKVRAFFAIYRSACTSLALFLQIETFMSDCSKTI